MLQSQIGLRAVRHRPRLQGRIIAVTSSFHISHHLSTAQTFLLVSSHWCHMCACDLMCSCCSDEEGSELADLQRVLQKVVFSKKANARQKQAEIIQVIC